MNSLVPQLPCNTDSVLDLARMAQSARRVLLVLEGKAPKRLKEDLAYDRWKGFAPALALIGLKLTLELRRRGRRAPLEFFVLRAPKSDFELPDWFTKDSDDA